MNLIELIKYREDNYPYNLKEHDEIIIGIPSGNYCTGYEYGLNSLILIRYSHSKVPEQNDCLTLDKLLDLLKYNKREILYHDKYNQQKGKINNIIIERGDYYTLLNTKIPIPEVTLS